MKAKRKTVSFTCAMILFYFLTTSLLNWFNGAAFSALGFYVFILFLGLLSLLWIIRIIKSPHYVSNKSTTASKVLFWVGVVLSVLLLFGMRGFEDILSAIYLFITLSSMAYLIAWYKKTGILETKSPIENPIIIDEFNDKIINDHEKPKSPIYALKEKLEKAVIVTPKGTDAYKYLIRAENITSGIIKEEIKTPDKVIKQIDHIIESYLYLSSLEIKTENTKETLKKVIKTFPPIVDGLSNIYEAGIDQNLGKIEVEAEALKGILNINGLNTSEFKEN